MLRQFIERTMEVREGEQRFSRQLRRAYFGSLGIKPPVHEEMIEGVGLREEGGRFRVDIDLVRTRRTGDETVRPRIAAAFMDDATEAILLVDAMNDPANLARANRVLSESGQIRDMSLVAAAGGLAYLGTLVSHL